MKATRTWIVIADGSRAHIMFLHWIPRAASIGVIKRLRKMNLPAASVTATP